MFGTATIGSDTIQMPAPRLWPHGILRRFKKSPNVHLLQCERDLQGLQMHLGGYPFGRRLSALELHHAPKIVQRGDGSREVPSLL
jgi:hypothetical protein